MNGQCALNSQTHLPLLVLCWLHHDCTVQQIIDSGRHNGIASSDVCPLLPWLLNRSCSSSNNNAVCSEFSANIIVIFVRHSTTIAATASHTRVPLRAGLKLQQSSPSQVASSWQLDGICLGWSYYARFRYNLSLDVSPSTSSYLLVSRLLMCPILWRVLCVCCCCRRRCCCCV